MMMNTRNERFIPLLLFLLLFVAPLQAANPVAEVVSVRGGASVIRSDGGVAESLVKNIQIFLNDKIKTTDNGVVKLLLHDDSVLKVSPSSELLISEMVVGPGDEQRATMNLLKGKLRSLVGKKLGSNSHFEVHTAVAVAGVRGTDFEVLAAEQTWVRCYEGIVAVGNIDDDIPELVLLQANMYTRVGSDLPPTQPEFIAPAESIEGLAGVEFDSAQDAQGSALDGLDDLETNPIADDSGAAFDSLADGVDELSLSQELLQEQLLGDVVSGQLDTVIEPPGNSSSLPMNITIPAP